MLLDIVLSTTIDTYSLDHQTEYCFRCIRGWASCNLSRYEKLKSDIQFVLEYNLTTDKPETVKVLVEFLNLFAAGLITHSKFLDAQTVLQKALHYYQAEDVLESDLRLQLAFVRYNLQEYDEAADEFERVLSFSPNEETTLTKHLIARMLLSKLYMLEGDEKSAESTVRSIFGIFPDAEKPDEVKARIEYLFSKYRSMGLADIYLDMLFNAALSLHEIIDDKGDLGKSISFLKNLRNIHEPGPQTDAYLQLLLGFLYLRKNAYKQAKSRLRKAIDLEKSKGTITTLALLGLAHLAIEQDDYQAAIDALVKCLDTDDLKLKSYVLVSLANASSMMGNKVDSLKYEDDYWQLYPEIREGYQSIKHSQAQDQPPSDVDLGDIRYADPITENLIKEALKVAPYKTPVLLSGESGVGKEQFSKLIHNNSKQKKDVFIKENASAIPTSLFESILFGIVAGAATGVKEQVGLIKQADRGTLFLDEISELPLEQQPKLLRVLEDGEYVPVGGDKKNPKTSNFRLICATNKNLDKEAKAGRFRKDLFARISVVHIHILPLGDRPRDKPPLFVHFLNEFSEREKKEYGSIEPTVLEAVIHADTPLNARTIESLAEKTMINIDPGARITTDDLPDELLASLSKKSEAPVAENENIFLDEEEEKRYNCIVQTGGNYAAAARKYKELYGKTMTGGALARWIESRDHLAQTLGELDLFPPKPGRKPASK
jgi:DNA-binding NtrC family response regulator/Tfp pilus assembly protein PilF